MREFSRVASRGVNFTKPGFLRLKLELRGQSLADETLDIAAMQKVVQSDCANSLLSPLLACVASLLPFFP